MLWIVDGLPLTKILFSLACHAVYSTNLANFPYISLVSIPFMSSVGKQTSHIIVHYLAVLHEITCEIIANHLLLRVSN